VQRKELQELSRIRLKEAKSLLSSGLYDGAYYLAGYAIECALKGCIAKRTRRYEFPEQKKVNSSYSHNLQQLMTVADLEEALNDRSSRDPEFQANWNIVAAWSEQSRYRRQRADLADALVRAVGDKRHGVISWIKLHW